MATNRLDPRYGRAVSTLTWIVVSGLGMSLVAFVGGITTVIPERRFRSMVMPLVALAAGALLGGAMFHMLPKSLETLDGTLSVFVWTVAGLFSFHVLEQFLHWHHCHRPVSEHRPLGYLILAADGLHNLIGGLAVGSAFVVDIRLGVVTWLVAAAHEVPQELGDFGILVHSGWSRGRALAYNVLSALTFPLGGLVAYGLAGRVDVAVLVPFAAGNFIYIAVADLLPEITTSPVPREKIVQTLTFGAGLVMLLAVAAVT
jgi:zinc and cadmium transporter